MTTGTSALDAAMKGFLDRLLGDTTYVALCSGGTYDAVPQVVTFPYAWLTVREDPREMETFGRMGFELEWRLQVYCRDDVYEGTKVIDQILQRAAARMHHGAVTLTGFNTPQVQYEGAIVMPLLRDQNNVVVRSKQGLFRGFAEAA